MEPIPQILPTAEPFLFQGSQAACLLIHGLTGTPKEMRPLGEHLHRQGFTVLGVRLTGHATQMSDLKRMRWRDWLASVEDGWHLLRSAGYGPIVLMGLSLGGILSLIFSTRFPVAGVVAMSTLYRLPRHPLVPFLRPLSFIRPYLPKEPPDNFDPNSLQGHIAYPATPLQAVAELRDLLAVMREALPRVQVPVLLIHSRNDQAVAPKNATRILKALGTADKELVWVERSGHNLLIDVDREIVFRQATDFARRVTAPRPAAEDIA